MRGYVTFSVLGFLIAIISFFLFRSSSNKINVNTEKNQEENGNSREFNLPQAKYEEKQTVISVETNHENTEKSVLRFIFKRNRKNEILEVQDKENIYEVNLEKMTCTCADFKKNRINFENDDVRRACKHILDKLKIKRLLDKHDDLTECVIIYGRVKINTVKTFMQSGEAVLICYDESEWVDVYARNRKKGETGGKYTGGYDRFGFNKSENRWSYRSGPPGAKEIRELIKKVV